MDPSSQGRGKSNFLHSLDRKILKMEKEKRGGRISSYPALEIKNCELDIGRRCAKKCCSQMAEKKKKVLFLCSPNLEKVNINHVSERLTANMSSSSYSSVEIQEEFFSADKIDFSYTQIRNPHRFLFASLYSLGLYFRTYSSSA